MQPKINVSQCLRDVCFLLCSTKTFLLGNIYTLRIKPTEYWVYLLDV